MNKRIVAVDVDGVLADFNEGYRARFIDITHEDQFRGETEPPCWNYPEYYGYTAEERKATWQSVLDDDEFWFHLNPYPDAVDFLNHLLLELEAGDDLYFITTRPGKETKLQTESWLEMMGVGAGTVLVSLDSGKGVICKGLGVQFMLDDKPENCADVLSASPETQVFLLNRKWNRSAQDDLKAKGVKVIDTLAQFLEVVKHG